MNNRKKAACLITNNVELSACTTNIGQCSFFSSNGHVVFWSSALKVGFFQCHLPALSLSLYLLSVMSVHWYGLSL